VETDITGDETLRRHHDDTERLLTPLRNYM